MWEQRESLKFKMFGDHSKASHIVDHTSSPTTTSKGSLGSMGKGSSSSSSSSGSSSSGIGKDKRAGNFVSRLGFKFDVANYDINAISPTSW